jgi:hypothetical protein
VDLTEPKKMPRPSFPDEAGKKDKLLNCYIRLLVPTFTRSQVVKDQSSLVTRTALRHLFIINFDVNNPYITGLSH